MSEDAIPCEAEARSDDVTEARVRDALDRLAALDLDWPADHLSSSRSQAGER